MKTKLFLEEMHEVCQSARVTNKDTHTPNPSKRQENIYIEREYTIAPDVLMHSISSWVYCKNVFLCVWEHICITRWSSVLCPDGLWSARSSRTLCSVFLCWSLAAPSVSPSVQRSVRHTFPCGGQNQRTSRQDTEASTDRRVFTSSRLRSQILLKTGLLWRLRSPVHT